MCYYAIMHGRVGRIQYQILLDFIHKVGIPLRGLGPLTELINSVALQKRKYLKSVISFPRKKNFNI